ncbi:hypothetical protein BmR1_04g07221 [Babesia microti strain RI]|uniref:Uncharacterized protein n=1 Tax=Babesia microti (strain RI) TaxID=1133968 RepID=A0A1N6LXX3_BABMR|nr:hypothetical protein BmR1_04g07221 [Babesia microti strain RI]SIO73730.1 hypothetical protein BmR1_04g07221 [Babesia microti strain RI]|eukprot:XP_021337796.1 hypothetical protein BmR1_04g07221 [Babesia microti strain RI]
MTASFYVAPLDGGVQLYASGVLGTIYHFFQDLILGVPNLFHNAVGMVVVESNDSRLVSNVYKFGDYVTSRAYEGGELARSFFLGSFTDKNPSLVGKYHDVAAKLSEAGADIPSIGQPVDTKENRHKFNLFSSSGLRGFAKTHEPSLLESLGK